MAVRYSGEDLSEIDRSHDGASSRRDQRDRSGSGSRYRHTQLVFLFSPCYFVSFLQSNSLDILSFIIDHIFIMWVMHLFRCPFHHDSIRFIFAKIAFSTVVPFLLTFFFFFSNSLLIPLQSLFVNMEIPAKWL